MKKIICSSLWLQRYLDTDGNLSEVDDEQYVTVSVADRALSIIVCSNKKMDIEARTDFTDLIQARHLKQLSAMLKTISEQPITLSFEDGWIYCIVIV